MVDWNKVDHRVHSMISNQFLTLMTTRFQPKNAPAGRLTPSNSSPSTAPTPASPSTYVVGGETDQAYLDRIKAREVISEAFLQVTRIKPDDPIDFLHNYFESQCQTKPYERAVTRLRLADPKHPSFGSLLVELYSNFNLLNEDVLLLKGDLYNKLLESLSNYPPCFGSKEHRATLLALVSLRPNDSVTFQVFKYGIQSVLMAKEFDKSVRLFFTALAATDADRSLCEVLLQILTDSLAISNKTPNDAFSLHESIVKLSPHQVKQSLEQRWSSSRSGSSKNRITLEDFQNLAMPIYLKTIKKLP